VVRFSVPDLVGGSVEQAESAVAGLWELAVVEEHSDAVAPGEIMAQSPESGTSLADGEVVTIVVSLGPEFLPVPAVAGLVPDDAIAEVTSVGFDYELAEEPSIDVAEGLVVRAEPAEFAAPGSTVLIVVSLGDVVLVPDVLGLDVDTATAELNAAGLFVGDVFASGCDAISAVDSEFDCTTFPDGGVAIISASPFFYAPRGSVVDLIVYDAGA
jgi:serine/threonine-protein kinase